MSEKFSEDTVEINDVNTNQSLQLSELPFVNIYLRIDEDVDKTVAFYKPIIEKGSNALHHSPIPVSFSLSLKELRDAINNEEHNDFSIDFQDIRLRGAKIHTFSDEIWVCLRRFPSEPPLLESLNFKPHEVAKFRSWGRRPGLILVGGATGAGKTTTIVGILNDYLLKYGEVAYTIEDPVEYYLQGPVGEYGLCFQIPVHEDEEWAKAIKTALRFAPRYIFLGEVRTSAAARQLLRAANSGHIVMCTVHGGSIPEILGAIHQLAEMEMGETAKSMLADGLTAVIHQRLERGVPIIKMLSTETGSSDPVRQVIRGGEFHKLGDIIEKQENIMKTTLGGSGMPTAQVHRAIGAMTTKTVSGNKS
jgi:Tfp pilus assembly pilus retraction ATPase PilT